MDKKIEKCIQSSVNYLTTPVASFLPVESENQAAEHKLNYIWSFELYNIIMGSNVLNKMCVLR